MAKSARDFWRRILDLSLAGLGGAFIAQALDPLLGKIPVEMPARSASLFLVCGVLFVLWPPYRSSHIYNKRVSAAWLSISALFLVGGVWFWANAPISGLLIPDARPSPALDYPGTRN
jgi:hypothetical protein